MSTALLVDGANVLMRALHAAKDSMSVDGVNTGPTAIFMTMLSRAVREVGATHVMVAFDPPGRDTFRDRVYPDYKATRKVSGPTIDVAGPLDLTLCVLEALGVKSVMLSGFEADDVIAAAWDGWEGEVVVMSGDKDLLQLVDDRTTVLRPTTGSLERWDAARVLEHYGVPASALATYLGLVGDVSDNLPGLRGVGPKKAVRLIEEHGEDFAQVVEAVQDKHSPEALNLAAVTGTMVDLRLSATFVRDLEHGPVAVHPAPLETDPLMTDDLRTILVHYRLERLRRSVEDGTLWGARTSPEQRDLLVEIEALDQSATTAIASTDAP